MKEKLKEYIPLSEVERKKIWTFGVFVLDANVLLNTCRYSKQSSDELLGIIKTHKDNIWLPYQVAMEFFNNRIGIIEGIKTKFEALLRSVREIDKMLESDLRLKEYKSNTALNIEQLRSDIKRFMKNTETKVKKWEKEFDDNDKDVILNEILSLYKGKVSDDFDTPILEEIYKEGEKRYSENIPPGFADRKEKEKKGKRSLYGDLIWWKQAIDYAKTNKKNLVIVTDDEKEDWWNIISGKTIGPRVELIKEFSKETGGRQFLMYKTHQFMEMAKKLDGAKVSASSIREAEKIGSLDYSQLLNLSGIDKESSALSSIQPPTIEGLLSGPQYPWYYYLGSKGRHDLIGSHLLVDNNPYRITPQDDGALGLEPININTQLSDMDLLASPYEDKTKKWVESFLNKRK